MKQSLKFIHESLDGLYDHREIESFCFIIINHLIGFTKSEMILNPDIALSDNDRLKVKEITNRLSRFEPIQYIIGQTEFYGLTFSVEPGVLIPRFETEELVDLIIRENSALSSLKILDLGCGSGCIAISLKKNFTDAEVWCCDISDKAIEVTIRNAKINTVNINVKRYDILGEELFDEMGFDLLVSNPPYVTEMEKTAMQANVLNHEPALALFVPDNDPLLYYRTIVDKSKELLLPNGKIYFEINEGYGKEVCELLLQNRFSASIIKDINGKDRIVKGIRQKKKEVL